MQLLMAFALAGVSAGYGVLNFPPAHFFMNTASTCSFGFLCGFLVIGSSTEEIPMQIIMAYLIISVAVTIVEKFLPASNEQDAKTKCLLCARIMLVLLFISIVQMFVEKGISLFIFSLLFTLWAMGKAGIEHTNQSFIEINREFAENIKKELQNFWDKKQ